MEFKSPMCRGAQQFQETISEDENEYSSPLPVPVARDDSSADLDSLPWHHAQLVMLYGRKTADDIMFPKMDPKRPKHTKKQLNMTGSSGASYLWNSLRKESVDKLHHEDRKIAPDLKKSYGAFVRQLVLQKDETPVKRNFYEKEDVPDMDHLLDRRDITNTLDIRHKMELMGRSSKINQDRTNILLHNNPIRNVGEDQQDLGIQNYFPSWMDEEDEGSEASYRKYLDDNSVTSIKTSESLKDLSRTKFKPKSSTREKSGIGKVVFMTEVESSAERGQFSNKYRQQRESENTNVENPDEFLPRINMQIDQLKPFRGDSISTPSDNQKFDRKFQTKWEPLTLNALVEYSNKRTSQIGSGDFMNGRVKMYPVSRPTSVHTSS